jgi:nucleoside-triphosphatase THEP1
LCFDFPSLLFYLLSMIWVLTGPVHSGKTGFLRGLAADLKKNKVKATGFLSPAHFEDGRLAGYDLLVLDGSKPVSYLRQSGQPGWEKVGPYFFIPKALERARESIRAHRPGVPLIVDEVGPLELRGGGLWPALAEVFPRPGFSALFVMRTACLSAFRRKMGGQPLRVFRVDDPAVGSALLNEIASVCAEGLSRPALEPEGRSRKDVG